MVLPNRLCSLYVVSFIYASSCVILLEFSFHFLGSLLYNQMTPYAQALGKGGGGNHFQQEETFFHISKNLRATVVPRFGV